MSEKRFILCNKTTDSNVWDTLEKQCYGWEYVVSLLNELNEENQELKRLIKKMGELGGFNKHLIKTICEDLE